MDRLEKRLNIGRQIILEDIIHRYEEKDLRSSEPKEGDIIEIHSEGNYIKVPSINKLPIRKLASLLEDSLDQHSMYLLIKAARKLVRYKSDGTDYRLTSASVIDMGDALDQNVASYSESALLVAMIINYYAKMHGSDERAYCNQGYMFKKGKRINSSAIYVILYSSGSNKYIIDLYNGKFTHVNGYSISYGFGKGHTQIFEDFSGNIVAISQYSMLFRPRKQQT